MDKSYQQYFRGVDMRAVLEALWGGLQQHGVLVHQTGPSSYVGKGGPVSWGMVPKVTITATPTQDGFTLDTRISPDFDTNGLIVFVVLWLFFFPAAIIIGVLAWQDFQKRQNALMQGMWQPVGHFMARAQPHELGRPGA